MEEEQLFCGNSIKQMVRHYFDGASECDIIDSEYAPIFEYICSRGFLLCPEQAEALFVCYILKQNYCKCMNDFWILYEAVYRVVSFSETIELWDADYKMYEGLRGRLMREYDGCMIFE